MTCRQLARACLLACLLQGGATSAYGQPPPTPAPPPTPSDEHVHPPPAAAPAEDHTAHQLAPALPSFIPPVTDEARAAAFPDVHGHATHDDAVNWLALFDQLEWQSGPGGGGGSVDLTGWVGKDRDRLWFRAEADRTRGRFDQAQFQAYYGRAVSRWWQVLAGLRQDARAGEPRTALALGVQGLAPYWLDVEASLYLEPSGRAHVRVEVEHDLLLTNRLVLQPLVETEVFTRSDRVLGIGRGLSTLDLGLRLRYEVRREVAPYVGIVWAGRFAGTADLARAAGQATRDARLVAGLRVWR